MDDRAEFEAWAKSVGWPHSWGYSNSDAAGFDSESWKAWQAATQRQQERINELEAQVAALRGDALNTMELDKPAQVGGGVFGVGVSVRHVISAAQRHYEHQSAQAVMTQEQRVDEERKRRAFWDLIHGPLDAAIAAGKGEA